MQHNDIAELTALLKKNDRLDWHSIVHGIKNFNEQLVETCNVISVRDQDPQVPNQNVASFNEMLQSNFLILGIHIR